MRASTLARSVSALVGATLAVGAFTMPAGAATPSGVTREAALTVVNGYRTGPLPAWGPGQPPEVLNAARDIFERSCKLAPGEAIDDFDAEPVTSPGSVDGMLAYAFLVDANGSDTRTCLIGVTAPVGPVTTLTGTSTLSVDVVRGSDSVVTPLTSTSTQKGDVLVTDPILVPSSDEITRAMFASSGSSVNDRGRQDTVAVRRTWSEKVKAKKAYDKKIAVAKKSYGKAVEKAGGSKAKKAEAQAVYKRKRAKARAAYRAAIRPTFVPVTRPAYPRAYSISTPWIG